MSEPVRIYIDAKPVDASPGSTLIDALAIASPEQAAQVRDGKRMLTDSRGLPALPDSEVFAGAIYRVVSARAAEQTSPTT
jgi:hypothetical protein